MLKLLFFCWIFSLRKRSTGNGERTKKSPFVSGVFVHWCNIIDGFWCLIFLRASFMIWQLSPKVKNITKCNNTFDSSLNQPGQQNWAINFLRIASQEIPSISEWVRNQYQWPISCHVLASGFLERKRDTDLHGAGAIHFHQPVQALDYICLWDCSESLWTFSKLERDATSPKVPITSLRRSGCFLQGPRWAIKFLFIWKDLLSLKKSMAELEEWVRSYKHHREVGFRSQHSHSGSQTPL